MFYLDYDMIFYYKTLLIIILPFIFSLLLLFFWVFYKIYKSIPFWLIVERFYVSCTLVFLFFLFSIINACAQFLDCTEFEGKFYVTTYLNESCTSEKYLFWKKFIIIPTLIAFAIVFPSIVLIYMLKNKRNLFQGQILSKIGFMLNGYQNKKFYWYSGKSYIN